MSERVLLVEGVDDEHVVCHLAKRYGDVPAFEIRVTIGFTNLSKSIPVEIKAPGRQVVGILADADDDPTTRWRTVRDRLRRANVVGVPDAPIPGGAVFGEDPRIGVWLMPDNAASGELEDFVAATIPKDDPVWPRARRYIADIPLEERKFTPGKTLRAEVHAWLATRKKPRKMGLAIGAGDLNVDGRLAGAFAEWLRRLFG